MDSTFVESSSLWFRQNFEQNISSSPRWIITLVQVFPALASIAKRDVRDHVQRVESNEVLQENVKLGVLHRPAKFFSHLPWPLRSLGLVAVQHRQPTRAAELARLLPPCDVSAFLPFLSFHSSNTQRCHSIVDTKISLPSFATMTLDLSVRQNLWITKGAVSEIDISAEYQ